MCDESVAPIAHPLIPMSAVSVSFNARVLDNIIYLLRVGWLLSHKVRDTSFMGSGDFLPGSET